MLSVIIPHFNQQEHLALLLHDLMPQAHRLGAEVIVVDNGSDRPPFAEVARFPTVRLVHQPIQGPGPARNLGVAVSGGEHLAFIDADCRPARDWLAQVRRGLAGAQVLGGDVRILVHDPQTPTVWEAYEAEYAYRMEHYIRDQGFTGTGNLAMRCAVFYQVGPFGGIGEAEDRDWGQRATAMGVPITWAPQMVVYHPARQSFAQLARKWGRMIAHDHAVRGGTWLWVAKAVALAGSPLWQVPRILRSTRIPGGWRGKVRAFAGLTAIRTYRARAMLAQLIAPTAGRAAKHWRLRN